MKKFLFVIAAVLFVFGIVQIPVQADGVIDWEGQGSENLPCTGGGHWVVAPSFNITGGTGNVNGASYSLTQNGGDGSWWFDSVGSISANSTAYVSYTGEGDPRNHLQLSHCIGGTDPTPTYTVVPPTETPDPTETPNDPTQTNTPEVPTETQVPTTTATATLVDPTSTNTPEAPTATTLPPSPTPTVVEITPTATLIPTLPIPPASTPEILPITGADLSSGPTPLGSAIFTIGGIFLVIVGLALKFKQ